MFLACSFTLIKHTSLASSYLGMLSLLLKYKSIYNEVVCVKDRNAVLKAETYNIDASFIKKVRESLARGCSRVNIRFILPNFILSSYRCELVK
jgi:hypothetical protein